MWNVNKCRKLFIYLIPCTNHAASQWWRCGFKFQILLIIPSFIQWFWFYFLLQHSTVSELQKFPTVSYRVWQQTSRIDKKIFPAPGGCGTRAQKRERFSGEEKSSDKKNETRRKRMLSDGCELTWPDSHFFRLSTFSHKFNWTRLYDNDGSKAKRGKNKDLHFYRAIIFHLNGDQRKKSFSIKILEKYRISDFRLRFIASSFNCWTLNVSNRTDRLEKGWNDLRRLWLLCVSRSNVLELDVLKWMPWGCG